MSADWSKGVEELVQSWQSDPLNARAAFLAYRDFLTGLENVSLDFKARPGVSYSLRARDAAQKVASCLSWWTWWTMSPKAAGCRSASMPI